MHPGALPFVPGGAVPPSAGMAGLVAPGVGSFPRPAMPGAPPLVHLFGVPHLPPPGAAPAAFRPGRPGLLPCPGRLASSSFFHPPGSHALAATSQERGSMAANEKADESSKPVTVYVGNINRHVDNDFLRLLLAECGRVIRWNRQADPTTGQLAAFGFCDFQDAVGALNALEVLPDLVIGGKALKVNCNEKVRAEVNRVKEDRVLSTLHTFRDKKREDVEKEIEEETARLRSAVLEVVKRKESQIPPDDAEEEAKPPRKEESKRRSSRHGGREEKEGKEKGLSGRYTFLVPQETVLSVSL
ncbi:PWI domain-containing protein [Toxoplasma gondii FOU]|uniref:PWI domain-containing protein n=2 Tax=Toxoplasma gondii TaxID=5811 RepID=A0A086LCI7_TOXGO|nr:PWI domain-containing protein [Toxoplasma gondii FOU]RQX75290.1 PWI domain-containing protein [Toxoplasma gondii CAST]